MRPRLATGLPFRLSAWSLVVGSDTVKVPPGIHFASWRAILGISYTPNPGYQPFRQRGEQNGSVCGDVSSLSGPHSARQPRGPSLVRSCSPEGFSCCEGAGATENPTHSITSCRAARADTSAGARFGHLRAGQARCSQVEERREIPNHARVCGTTPSQPCRRIGFSLALRAGKAL